MQENSGASRLKHPAVVTTCPDSLSDREDRAASSAYRNVFSCEHPKRSVHGQLSPLHPAGDLCHSD